MSDAELVEFLRARLAEDEQAARRAGDSFRQIGETGVIVATEGDRAEECATANWAGIADHIVRHDPARVLAEVAAKRRIIERYADNPVDEWPLFPLLELAAIYASHPDYREEWRP